MIKYLKASEIHKMSKIRRVLWLKIHGYKQLTDFCQKNRRPYAFCLRRRSLVIFGKCPMEGVRKMTAKLITGTYLQLLRRYDHRPEQVQAGLLDDDGPAYIRVFLSILRDITKEETVEYVLALIDDMLTANPKVFTVRREHCGDMELFVEREVMESPCHICIEIEHRVDNSPVDERQSGRGSLCLRFSRLAIPFSRFPPWSCHSERSVDVARPKVKYFTLNK